MRAQLTVVAGEAKPDTIEMAPDQPVSIGRSRDNSVVIPRDEHTSRLHAKVYFENGRWFVRDFGLNGTRVDGERIDQVAELDHNAEIRIGDVKFKFTLPDQPAGHSNKYPSITADRLPSSETPTLSATKLQLDELTSLCQFMAVAVESPEAHDLVRQAIQAVLQQTGASLVGYLSLDPSDPLPKLVLPETAQVDVQLSRHLTRRVQRDSKTVWLGADSTMTRPSSDSLVPFQDAMCIPLKAAGQALGAVHVYKANSYFTERDTRYCEALAGYLAHGLLVLKERRKLEAENSRLRAHLPTADELLGDSQAMVNLRLQISRAAPQPFTVLVQGESGVGKELVALALHRKSNRAGGPLVVVNCAAIPSALMEAELFGYRKNSFTGALNDHPGLFQQADEGTLFLDEVGELSAECQAKLLRVIEGKSFRPLGATGEVKADVRIVAASNRNLEGEVKAGRFRQDLFFRFKVIQIQVPPLREHPEDIAHLVHFFLDKLAVECRRSLTITDEALRELYRYAWPGNVRQLRGLMESLAVMSEDDAIDVDAVRRALPRGELSLDVPPSLNWDDLERWAVERALKQTSGNVSQAASVLGMSRDTLYGKLKKWGIQRSSEVAAQP
jgi:two-component system, NtrC family, response regulator HydG